MTATAVRCIAFGCRIETDLVIPGAIRDDDAAPPEIVVRLVAKTSPFGNHALRLWREGPVLHFSPPGVAHYAISSTSIDVGPCRGADEAAIVALLIATALPGLLWLRGAFVLHAAAAVLPGCRRAVAVSAPSGAGKSTVLSQLVEKGAGILADDGLGLRRSTGGIDACGLPGGYFTVESGSMVRRFVATDRDRAIVEAPLGSIFVISRHDGDAPARIQRLAPFEAVAAILSNRHRPSIPDLLGDPGRRLEDALRIALIPTYSWSRPHGSPCLTTAEWRAIVELNGERR